MRLAGSACLACAVVLMGAAQTQDTKKPSSQLSGWAGCCWYVVGYLVLQSLHVHVLRVVVPHKKYLLPSLQPHFKQYNIVIANNLH